MIFLTVGTQFPFDRLVTCVDDWNKGRRLQIIGQVGDSSVKTKNIECYPSLTPKKYGEYFSQADVVVAHAGMGTIINALLSNKPVIIMPRNSDLKEHRNQHQFATCKRFSSLDGCYIANDEFELIRVLDRLETLSGGAVDNVSDTFNENLRSELSSLVGMKK